MKRGNAPILRQNAQAVRPGLPPVFRRLGKSNLRKL